MAGPSFAQMQTGMAHMAESIESAHTEAQGVADAFAQFMRNLVPAIAGAQALNGIFGNIRVQFKAAFTGLQHTAEELDLIHDKEIAHLDFLLRTGEINQSIYDAEMKRMDQQARVHAAQATLAETVELTGRRNIQFFKASITMVSEMILRTRELNQNLINANSSSETRNKLLHDTLMTQIQTGASFNEATEAAKALVFYGQENRSDFQKITKLVMQLNDGLGMSIHHAAELAANINRAGGDFEQVANVMATLVNSTALTADEAERLAVSLTKIMATVGPGIDATALPEVAKLVGQYESAIKRLGGQAGTVEQLLARLTTPEGMAAAGFLGVTSPEFVRTQAGVQQVMDSFAAHADQLLENASGWDRRWRLQFLSEQLGMTADQITLLMKASKRTAQEIGKDIGIQERFNEQIRMTGTGLLRLGNSLTALLSGALYPVVWALNYAISFISKGLEYITAYAPVAYGVMGFILSAAVTLTTRMRHLAVAFLEVMFAARAAEVAARAQARANASQAAGGLLGGGLISGLGSMRGVLVWGFKLLVSPLSLIVTGLIALGGTLYATYLIQKRAAEQDKQAADARYIAGKTHIQRATALFYDELRRGQFDYLQGDFFKRFKARMEVHTQDMEPQKRFEEYRKAYEDMKQAVDDAVYTTSLFRRPQDASPQYENYLRQTAEVLTQIKSLVEENAKELKVREEQRRTSAERTSTVLRNEEALKRQNQTINPLGLSPYMNRYGK